MAVHPEPHQRIGTLVLELGDGDDGETIAFNPDDGLLYHASGLGNQNNAAVGEIFETIDLDLLVITSVPLSGFDYEGLSSLLYRDGAFYAGDLNPSGSSGFFRITTGGVVTYLGDMDHVAKGLVAVPEPGAALLLGAGWLLIFGRREAGKHAA